MTAAGNRPGDSWRLLHRAGGGSLESGGPARIHPGHGGLHCGLARPGAGARVTRNHLTMKPGHLHDLRDLALLGTAAGALALLANTLREAPLPWEHADRTERLNAAVARLGGTAPPAAVSAKLPERIEESAVAQISGDPAYLILDVRPDLFFEDGHLPGALNLPRDKMDSLYPALKSRLEEARGVVVYCAGRHCDEAEAMIAALKRLGHENLSWYPGGWAEWSAHGRPMEKADRR